MVIQGVYDPNYSTSPNSKVPHTCFVMVHIIRLIAVQMVGKAIEALSHLLYTIGQNLHKKVEQ